MRYFLIYVLLLPFIAQSTVAEESPGSHVTEDDFLREWTVVEVSPDIEAEILKWSRFRLVRSTPHASTLKLMNVNGFSNSAWKLLELEHVSSNQLVGLVSLDGCPHIVTIRIVGRGQKQDSESTPRLEGALEHATDCGESGKHWHEDNNAKSHKGVWHAGG